MTASNLEKFLHQNRANIIDCFEGCLLDNLLCYTKHGGIMAIYERYINCWTSGYYIEFTKDKSEADMIYRDFDILRKNAEMAI
jgi:hypothetical protein